MLGSKAANLPGVTTGRVPTAARLDTLLILFGLPPYMVVLSRTLSDHAPLLVSYKDSLLTVPKPFRYQHMWAAHPSFQQVVRESWTRPYLASPLCVLVGKLKRLKQDLKKWNKEVFLNLFSNLAVAEDDVLVAQHAFDIDPSAFNLAKLNEAKCRLKRNVQLASCY